MGKRITQEEEMIMRRYRYEDNLPVKVIAKERGCSKTTVYNHTKSKEPFVTLQLVSFNKKTSK